MLSNEEVMKSTAGTFEGAQRTPESLFSHQISPLMKDNNEFNFDNETSHIFCSPTALLLCKTQRHKHKLQS